MEGLSEYLTLILVGGLALLYFILKRDLYYSLCIFTVPLSVAVAFAGGSSLSAPSEIMVLILAIVTLVLLVSKTEQFKTILIHPLSLILLADLVWMTIAAIYSEMPLISFKRVVARFLFLTVFYILTAHWFEKKERMPKFFFLFTLGLIVPILFTFYKHSGFGFDPRTVYELSLPFFSDHTIYGAVLAFVIPFLLIVSLNATVFRFSKSLSIVLYIVTLLVILAELLSFSRAGWLSSIVCFVFYILLRLNLKFKHFFLGVATLLILLFIFKDVLLDKAKTNKYQSDTQKVGEHLLSSGNLNTNVSNLERWNRWKCAIRMFLDRPITGFGPGTYQFVYGPYQLPAEMTRISSTTGNRGNAHSDPLTSLSETGLPGFVLFLLWIFATIRYGFKAYYQTTDLLIKNMVLAALLGFVTFIFHGFFNSFIDQVKLAGLVFGSMAIIVAADMALKSKPVYNEKKEIN